MEGDGDGDGSELGGLVTSRRVVHGRRGNSPVLALLVVAVLAAAGFVLTSGGTGSTSSGETDDPSDQSPAAGEMEVTTAAEASEAYAQAALRLERGQTFAYRGTVRADGTNAVRPGPWTAESATVEGAVDLARAITTEVAVHPSGAAVETVTSRAAVWARNAPSLDGLADAPWESLGEITVGDPEQFWRGQPESRLSVALLATALQAAGDRREAPRDDTDRRVIQATVPDRVGLGVGVGWQAMDGLLTGAELAVTLDDAGDIAHVELTSAPGSPLLEVDLDIVRRGDPGLATAHDVAEPIRQTVPADMLAAVGVERLDLTGLPSSWALTYASVDWPHDPRRGEPPPACAGASVSVEYSDLGAVSDGWMSLWVRSGACAEAMSGEGAVGTGPSAYDVFTAGRFSGGVYDSPGNPLSGWLTDGSTWISFSTDLSPAGAAAALASLAPAA